MFCNFIKDVSALLLTTVIQFWEPRVFLAKHIDMSVHFTLASGKPPKSALFKEFNAPPYTLSL